VSEGLREDWDLINAEITKLRIKVLVISITNLELSQKVDEREQSNLTSTLYYTTIDS